MKSIKSVKYMKSINPTPIGPKLIKNNIIDIEDTEGVINSILVNNDFDYIDTYPNLENNLIPFNMDNEINTKDFDIFI